MSEWWQDPRLKGIPFHMKGDAYNAILVEEKGLTKCTKCGGTGNQLYSTYQKCTDCDGTGNTEKQPIKG